MGNGKSVQRKVQVDESKKKESTQNEKLFRRKPYNKSVQLKVYVDEKKKKVMFAEANEEFVKILFSFFTLPLGTIARLLRKHADSKNIKVGSLSSLYEGVLGLNVKQFYYEWYKSVLLNPRNSSASFCKNLKVNLDERTPVHSLLNAVFFKKKTNFIITDDLNVVPVVLDTSISLFNSLGVEYLDSLEEKTMYFGLEEFSNLLKWSLLTHNPLTNLVFAGDKPCSCSSLFTNSTLITSTFKRSNYTPRIKLVVQKSKNKVLYAQVENDFVELLFSFLTIPLGAYKHLTNDNSSRAGISNLYNSIRSCLIYGEYMFLSPKVAASYHRVTNLLPIYEVNALPGRFLKEQGTYIVSDDLKITASPSIATISKFNTPGVPICDMELVELSIGEQEALFLLKASLTSTSALTDCLKASREKPKDHVPQNRFL